MSDLWQKLRLQTQARIGLGRAGAAIKTSAWLEFQRAHAEARDAVWQPWRVDEFASKLEIANLSSETILSRAQTRDEFLLNPHLGRRLRGDQSLERVPDLDLAIVVSDGLSAKAVDLEFLPFWMEFAKGLKVSFSKVILVPFGRVAIADEIGEALGAKISLMFIGERPGLSVAASMGIYLTYGPKVGNHDAARNCLSNIHPHGMSSAEAAEKARALVGEALRLRLSGVALKELDGRLLQSKG